MPIRISLVLDSDTIVQGRGSSEKNGGCPFGSGTGNSILEESTDLAINPEFDLGYRLLGVSPVLFPRKWPLWKIS